MKHSSSFKAALALCTVLAALSGCAQTQETTTMPIGEPSQKLLFTVTESEETFYTSISKEELGENADVSVLAYGGFDEVSLQINGQEVPLPQAIREGTLTTAELFAFARMDANNGYCEESYTSERGLTSFDFTYPECKLYVLYDVYETPDGRQTLINEIYINKIAENSTTDFFFIDEDSKWGYLLDREDWGLTFQVAEATPTQLTLDYTQQDGQQVGELSLSQYSIYRADEYDDPDCMARPLNDWYAEFTDLPVTLLRDGSGQVTIDWSDLIGALEPGDYYVKLGVSDVYDESQIHPLIVKYHNNQGYYVAFSIQ